MDPMAVAILSRWFLSSSARVISLIDYGRDFVARDETLQRIIEREIIDFGVRENEHE